MNDLYGESTMLSKKIKVHSEYKDVKQTVITRCRVVA